MLRWGQKTEEEKYTTVLFVVGERGREIFNTWTWEKLRDAAGNETDKDDITVAVLFNKFEEYCTPRKNLVVERWRFFLRSQEMEESIDSFVTELRNLAATCEIDAIRD